MQRSARDWLQRAFQSLAARVSFFVFAATLTSALAVAWTSAHALRAFLRSKVEQKIPAAVLQVRDRLDLWYAHRSLDVQTFARSTILVDGLASRASRAREEARAVPPLRARGPAPVPLDRRARRRGQLRLGVGDTVDPPRRRCRPSPARTTARSRRSSRIAKLGAVQAITSVVRGRDGRRLFTLHAILPVAALEEHLAARRSPARTLVFDRSGGFR